MQRSRALALALVPFAVGAFALRQAVAPVGDAIAVSLIPRARSTWEREPPRALILPSDPAGSSDGFWIPLPQISRQTTLVHLPKTNQGDSAGTTLVDSGVAVQGTIVVPAAAVARAIERRDVGAVNAVSAEGTPVGAALRGVGRYRTGLRDGDVVVSVAGTPTPNVGAMVAAGTQAAASGATRISGRIMRGDATFDVVLELPK